MGSTEGRRRARQPVFAGWGVVVGLAVALAACGGAAGTGGTGQAGAPTGASTGAVATGGPIFRDVAASTGLNFTHFNGMIGQRYFVEFVGAGGALFDYDNDGDLDVFLPQGYLLGSAPSGTTPAGPAPAGGRLYRNDLTTGPDGKPVVHFTDVTEASGIKANGYGIAVTTGDYNNDGFVDLYLSNWGSNQLWRNKGDGTFEDVTKASGTDDPRWSTGASFVDYDKDGWLDLVVVNYNQWTIESNHPCYHPVSSRPDYCGPSAYPAVPSSLFRNRGDGTFEDVSLKTGLATKYGPALGVIAADFNRDGWPDILIANDGQPNTLWINDSGHRFTEDALARGVAVNRAGLPEGNMGIAAEDFNDKCSDDVFITHLNRETNTLWANDGTGVFEDVTPGSGLGQPSLAFTGFGVAPLDYDNDGKLDLFVANGAVVVIAEQLAAGNPLPLEQTNQLFHGLGGGKFEDATARAGDFITHPAVGRGVAMGDIDNDGDSDLLVTYNNGPVQLLENLGGQDHSWLGLRLVGGTPQRDMVGAEVTAKLSDGRTVCRRAHTDGSYASASDPRILLGLGNGTTVSSLSVRWPDGKVEAFPVPATGKYTTLVAGKGQAAGQ
jgi:hypothetical protein